MIGVDLIGDIRRAYFEHRRPIKEIVRDACGLAGDCAPGGA
jgi:hypothetical protein